MEFAGCRMAAGIFFAQRRVPLAFRAHGAYNNSYFLDPRSAACFASKEAYYAFI